MGSVECKSVCKKKKRGCVGRVSVSCVRICTSRRKKTLTAVMLHTAVIEEKKNPQEILIITKLLMFSLEDHQIN